MIVLHIIITQWQNVEQQMNKWTQNCLIKIIRLWDKLVSIIFLIRCRTNLYYTWKELDLDLHGYTQ